jgi:phage host-nuclease inhibitor protein Gam
MTAKTAKVPSAKALARKRTIQERKQIAAQIRSVEKIARSFEKAQTTLAAEVAKLDGDVKEQLEQVLAQIGVAVTIVDAEVESQATALARTFVKR